MKIFKCTLLLFFITAYQLSAQSFNEAMVLYENEEYEEAALLFSQLDDEQAALFAGKSHFAMFNYGDALAHLSIAAESNRESVRDEAVYTLALTHFGLKNYDRTLTHLHEIANGNNRTGLIQRSGRLYKQILNFLTKQQRFELLYKIDNTGIRLDLVNSSRPFLSNFEFNSLVSELIKLTPDEALKNRIQNEFAITDELRNVPLQYPTAPNGMVYTVGVVLPVFEDTDPDFSIPRNLYYGILLAADEFNSRNTAQKVNIVFKNSAENEDTTAVVFNELSWINKIDAAIGPLFSEPAITMAALAEEYQIPMLAPLANSENLNLDYNYTFQINPTPEIHGRKMANFAVEELGLDTLAVITENKSPGRISALAFRHEAERLGAHISYYIEQDFASTGYDFSEVTEVFTADISLRDSLGITPSDAIYAPFTGQASSTMKNLLLNNLEAMRSEVILLGSEEWKYDPLTDFQQRFFEIYYTESATNTNSDAANDFFRQDYETRFGDTPDQFARLGYDTANYLFQSLETAGNPKYLNHVLRNKDIYNGISTRIFMDGKRINQHLFVRPLSQKAKTRIGQ